MNASFARFCHAALLASLFAGCAAYNPTNPAPAAETPTAGAATIVGWGNTAAENARAAMNAEFGTRVTRLYVSFVNGRKTGFGENTVRVQPGADVIVMCGIYVDYRFFTYDERLEAKLEPNRVYELRANAEGRRCRPYLEDVTGRKG